MLGRDKGLRKWKLVSLFFYVYHPGSVDLQTLSVNGVQSIHSAVHQGGRDEGKMCTHPPLPRLPQWWVFLIISLNSYSFIFYFLGCAGFLLWHVGSKVAAHRLSYPTVCGIFVPQSGVKPEPPALEGRFLTTGPPGKLEDGSS